MSDQIDQMCRTIDEGIAEIAELRDSRDFWREQCEENGRTAEVLLAALRAILPWHDPHPIQATDNPVVNQCRAAIATAEGTLRFSRLTTDLP